MITTSFVVWGMVALVGAAICGLTAAVVLDILRKGEQWPHVVLMAASYILLLICVVLLGFPLEGLSRFIPIALAMIAVLLGFKGVLVIAGRRAGFTMGFGPRWIDVKAMLWVIAAIFRRL